MPTYEVWYETVITTPKIRIVAKDQTEALVAYKAKMDKEGMPGDFITDFKPRAVTVWRSHQ